MNPLAEAREFITATLGAALPSTVTVYGYPPQTPVEPAVSLAPGDDWHVEATLGATSRVNLEVRCHVNAQAGNVTALELLEALSVDVRDALNDTGTVLVGATARPRNDTEVQGWSTIIPVSLTITTEG